MQLKNLIVLLLIALLSIGAVRADDEPVADVDEPVADAADAADDAADAADDEEASAPLGEFSAEELEQMKANEESFEFQAEVNRLMDIIINSLYSNREIFIRELISNAADALDKIRFQSLTDKDMLGDTPDLEIKIKYDKDAKTLTLTDSGVGMTKDELVKNLGVVAKSGTTEFVEAASQDSSDSLSLIGQFGVGFYSVYLVADKVTVVSKSNNDDQWVWESTADRTFTVTKDPRGNTLGRGTSIILTMKEDAEEFLEEGKLKSIVGRYSEFINFPISLWTTKTVSKEVPIEEEETAADSDSEDDSEKSEDDLEISEEEDDDEKEEKPKTKTVQEEVSEWTRLNEVKAIWTRSKDEITDEEYNSFYKSLSKSSDDPLTKIHFSAEGEISFRAILYIPSKADSNLYDKYYEKSQSLKLYVRRVLISDEFDDFLPRYLNFVKGVVDSEDLPLNVSRETLAQSRVLKVMSKKLTRKVLEMLKKLAAESEKDEDDEEDEDEDEEADSTDAAKEDEDEKKDEDAELASDEEVEDKYNTFWENFGKSIKLGLIDDRANKSKLSKLLRFKSSKSDGKFISLEQYVDNMQDEQKYIYYITGESLEAVEDSPFLERVVNKDFEVLYLVDPLDEYVTQSLNEFDGNTLMSVTKEGLKLGDEDADRQKRLEEEWKPFTEWLKGVYGDKVEKVTISSRLATSPCVLVTGQYGWSANMERIMKAQTFADSSKQSYMKSKKTMEINYLHPIIRSIKEKSEADDSDQSVTDLANLLFDAALIQSGFSVGEATDFASRIHRVVSTGLDIDPNAPMAEPEPDPEPEDEEEEEEEVVEAADDDAADPVDDAADDAADPVDDAAADDAADPVDDAHDEL
jgi:heat shock protein beta